MKKLIKWFELDRHYKFDIADLTALMYTICAIGCMMGYNMTILFAVAATIGVATCWMARRVNLVVLNLALWIMNLYNCIMLIVGG